MTQAGVLCLGLQVALCCLELQDNCCRLSHVLQLMGDQASAGSGPGSAAAAAVNAAASASATGPAPPVAADAGAAAARVGEVELPSKAGQASAVAESAEPLIVLLYGAPLAGVSKQAVLLSKRYGIPAVTVDQLLLEAYEQLQAQSVAAVAAAATAAAPVPATPAQVPAEHARLLYDQLTRLLLPGPGLVTGANGAAAGGSDVSSAASPRVQQQAPGRSAQASANAHRDAAAQQQAPPLSPQDVVTAALKHALQLVQYHRGFVLDGLESRHLPSAVAVARCVLRAAGLACRNLQQPEQPLATATAAGAAKGPKGSRPPSSRPGVKTPAASTAAAAAEHAAASAMPLSPDVWEGAQLVSDTGCPE